jgi:hypothetical protein
MSITDLTEQHDTYKKWRERSWSNITGITLHQTACRLGVREKRWHSVSAHVGIPRNGRVFHIHPLHIRVPHAPYFNGDCVGIEIDGSFYGVEGVRQTHWADNGGPHVLKDEQIAGAREAIAWIVQQGADNGTNIKNIYAHRQASANRESDPGSAIWQAVGLWAQEELHLVNEPMHTRSTGLPIPEEWDPRSVVNYRGRRTDRGVRWYQEILGFTGDDIDGDHGSMTTKALRIWQTDQGLEVTGRVDGPTRQRMEDVAGPPPAIEG